MVEAIRYAHLHGCRLYMTVNTLFKEKELEELRDYIKPYYEAGLDGVIVQDLGALQAVSYTHLKNGTGNRKASGSVKGRGMLTWRYYHCWCICTGRVGL